MANKILLVDGNGRSVRRTRQVLQASGYRVETAKNARTAVQAFRRLRPDLTLIDAHMRSKSGFSVREQLRRIPHGRRASIVVLTPEGEGDAFNVDLPGDCRAEDCVARPSSDAALLSAVERMVMTDDTGNGDQGHAPSTQGRAVVGDLDAFGLPEIVQTIALGRKTAKIVLRSGQRQGSIWFVDGAPLHAEAGGLLGEEAFYRMLTWKAGQFEIDRRLRPADQSIDSDAMYLVMEGLRRIDEAGRLSGNGHSDDGSSPRGPSDRVDVVERMNKTSNLAALTEGAAPSSAPPDRVTPRRAGRALFAGVMVLAVLATGGWQAWETGWLRLGWSQLVGSPEPMTPPPSSPAVDLGVGITYADLPGLESFTLFEPGGPSLAHLLNELPESGPGPGELSMFDEESVAPKSDEQRTSASGPREPGSLPRAGIDPADPPVASAAVEYIQPLGPVAPEPGILTLSGRSTLKAGRLELSVDGQVVYRRGLASDKRASKRSKERFEARIEVPPGEHTVVARLELEDGAYGYESVVSVAVEPGGGQTLTLVAGKSKARPIILTSE